MHCLYAVAIVLDVVLLQARCAADPRSMTMLSTFEKYVVSSTDRASDSSPQKLTNANGRNIVVNVRHSSALRVPAAE